jgi:uncharacterized protein YndB with AHSA1/START domain
MNDFDQERHLPSVERTVDLDAPPDEVWERIIDGRLAEEWLGVVLEPRPGGNVGAPEASPAGDVLGVVEDVEPGRSITWTWRRRDGDPSQVTVAIDPVEDGGTRVTVIERLLDYEIASYPPIVLSAVA